MQAMFTMKKIDIAKIEAAAEENEGRASSTTYRLAKNNSRLVHSR